MVNKMTTKVTYNWLKTMISATSCLKLRTKFNVIAIPSINFGKKKKYLLTEPKTCMWSVCVEGWSGVGVGVERDFFSSFTMLLLRI